MRACVPILYSYYFVSVCGVADADAVAAAATAVAAAAAAARLMIVKPTFIHIIMLDRCLACECVFFVVGLLSRTARLSGH